MTNREQLKILKSTHGLTSQDVADKLAISIHTVNSWLYGNREMPDNELRLLRYILIDRPDNVYRSKPQNEPHT